MIFKFPNHCIIAKNVAKFSALWVFIYDQYSHFYYLHTSTYNQSLSPNLVIVEYSTLTHLHTTVSVKNYIFMQHTSATQFIFLFMVLQVR